MKVAVIGASGFIGTRLIETLVLGKEKLGSWIEVVPIVRSFASLAVLARFAVPWKVCDIFDPQALAQAFEGCQVVVHAALGDPHQIVRMAKAIYQGAQLARVRRLVVVSSSSVHGQAPPVDTEESSPLHEQHLLDYSNAKVSAEKLLTRLSMNGSVELVLLRPSVVYGPRSRWVADCANELLSGTAYLINEGSGICNAIYVDNLIQAILKSLETPQAAGQAFFLRDIKTVTWYGFYAAIAAAFGIEMSTVHRIDPPEFSRSVKERVYAWVATPMVQSILPVVPFRIKRMTKAALASWDERAQSSTQPPAGQFSGIVSKEMALLQQCTWTMPISRAEALLGYAASVSFDEGMERTIGWLEFAGFPVSLQARSKNKGAPSPCR